MDAQRIGCAGIQRALEVGYLKILNVYIEPDGGDETRPVLVMTDREDDEALAFDLNYCPFCGSKVARNMPTCANRIGKERRQVRDVRVQS